MDISFILLIALICVAIGFLVGRLVHSLEGESDAAKTSPGKGLKVWYDPETDRLVVEIDGRAYRQEKALNSRQRRHIHRALFRLNAWLSPGAPERIAAKPQKPLEKRAVQPVTPSVPKQPPRRFSPVSTLVEALQADIPSPLPSESMIAQIDHILQGKLAAAGLQDKAVRLMEIPGKGMVVMIGLESYNEVADIPDEEIKSLLRAAVREWEQRDSQHGV